MTVTFDGVDDALLSRDHVIPPQVQKYSIHVVFKPHIRTECFHGMDTAMRGGKVSKRAERAREDAHSTKRKRGHAEV